ncbi:MAG: trigger factor [Eggerthellales bacterium]|nr:trigger factor [Eggerthellales bacterium]
MKTQVEALQDDQLRLTITAEQAEVDARIKSTYKDFANRYKFPGFRKGKAPRPVIDNVLGAEAVLATVTEDITNSFFPLAMDAENLCPIDEPRFENTDDLVEEGKDFVFSLIMTMAPDVELTSYEPVQIKLLDENPTEKDIDDRIEALTMYYYDMEDAPADQPIKESGIAELTLAVTDDKGNAVNVLSTENRMYELGMGLYPASLDAALEDMKTGDTKQVTVNLEEENSILMKALDGNPKTITFDVTVNCVKTKVYPEVTEEFATEKAGFKSIEDMRARTAENIVRERQEYLPKMKENACLYKLIERYPGEVPEVILVQERRDLLTGFFQQLNQQGVTFDQYLKQRELTNEQFQEDLKRQAHDIAMQNLAIDAYAKHFGMTVSDEEIEEEFNNSGMEDVEAVKKQFREEGRIRILRRNIVRSNAIDDIMDKAIVETVDSEAFRAENEAQAKAAEEKAAKAEEKAEEAPAEEKPKKLTKKQALQAKADELGISYTQKNTIAELEAMIAEAE